MDTLSITNPSISMGLQAHYGFIIPHSESIRSVSHSNPWGAELDFAWHYSDPKSQSYCNCFPRLGVSLRYINFDNSGVLGHAFSLAPYAEPFIPIGTKWMLSVRFLAGAAYLNNVYHPVKNPDNLFYSTHLSYLLSLSPVINFRVTPKWNLRIGGNYNHISNGGNRQPNKGINFPSATIGVDYVFKKVDFSKKALIEVNTAVRKNTWRLIVLGTGKFPLQESKHRKLIYGFNIAHGFSLNKLSVLTAGFEYVNDGSLKEELSKKYLNPPDHKRAAILAGHELQIGRFDFSQQLGIYIYSPEKPRDPVYQRWGLNYSLYRTLKIGLNLKAHRHVADFLDFRLTYVL